MKTNRMRDLQISERMSIRSPNLARYFVDVRTIPLLTSDEENAIGARVIAGDEAAVTLLVNHNLRFVISVAKQYGTSPDLLSDLICQGNIGLIAAARSFDPTRGFRFISYAVWHIRREIFEYLGSKNRTIRLPGNVQTNIKKARTVEAALLVTLDREATTYEIVEELLKQGIDIEPQELEHAFGIANGHTALESEDTEIFSPINWLPTDINKPDSKLLDEEHRTTILRLLDTLCAQHRDIVCARLGLYPGGFAESFKDISARYNRGNEWARLVYNRVMLQLKISANRLLINQNN